MDSSENDVKPRLRAAAIVCGTYASYFILYSGYKKPTPQSTLKGLDAFKGSLDLGGELPKIFAPSQLGSSHSNRQLNKVWGLAGLTLSGLATMPRELVWKNMLEEQTLVLRAGVVSLVTHVLYSYASFYKWSPMKLLRGEGKNMKFEQLGVLSGACSISTFLWCAYRRELQGKALAAASSFGMFHFYLLETRSGWPEDLPVRPWGYCSFIVPSVAVALVAWSSLGK